jgi:hypothetical protein
MAQYCPTNAIEMIEIMLTEFTITANLRHFFVPREVVPRTIATNMLPFDYHDNPVSDYFRLKLTIDAQCTNLRDQLRE